MKYCFDLDDTLYDCSQPFVKAMHEFFPAYCDNIEEKYSYYRYIGDINFPRVLSGEMSTDQNGESRIEEMCKKYKIPYEREEIYNFQQAYKFNQYNLELSPVLKEFFENNHFTFGILTNGDVKHQTRKVEALGLFKYIEPNHVVTSMGIHISKPNPGVFKKYFEIIQDDSKDWIYIGDAYKNDIECSHIAGLKNIYFDRHKKKEGNKADYTVYSEEELVKCILNIEKGNI